MDLVRGSSLEFLLSFLRMHVQLKLKCSRKVRMILSLHARTSAVMRNFFDSMYFQVAGTRMTRAEAEAVAVMAAAAVLVAEAVSVAAETSVEVGPSLAPSARVFSLHTQDAAAVDDVTWGRFPLALGRNRKRELLSSACLRRWCVQRLGSRFRSGGG